MLHAKYSVFIAAVVFLASFKPACSQEFGASWLRTRTLANALNPKISLIGDFVARSGPDSKSSGMSLRETELAIQSEIDPYARADFFISKPDGAAVELEEGYITLLSLPLGFQARGGKFLANFGRLNMTHQHERAQVDAPLVLDKFLGKEGLNDTGVELSRIFAPFGLFSELTYSFLNGLGESEEEEPATAKVMVAGGGEATVRVHEEEKKIPRKLRNFAHVLRTRLYGDLTKESNLELGLSGALHQPGGFEHRRMAGLDLTFRWKPLQEGLYKSFLWRTEALYSQRRLLDKLNPITEAVEEAAVATDRRGVYSYVEYQPARRWRLGLRGDYAEDPNSRQSKSVTRALSPYITFILSEFNRFRVQYQAKGLPNGKTDHLGFLQWVIVLGPHGAHPF